MSDPRKIDFIQDFDADAAHFLENYGYGDLVNDPHPIPIREIAEKRMLLNIVDTECLSPDESVQGIITFSGGIIDVYDPEENEFIGYEASRNTVFLDALMTNPGRVNNTLAHECFHWYKHRHYFLYQELHASNGESEFGFRCQIKTNPSEKRGHYSEADQMEYQARLIAPKILMPKAATKKKIEEIYHNVGTHKDISDVVDIIADFFQVSRQSAAIRMTELGYSEATLYCTPQLEYMDLNTRKSISSKAVHRQQKISVADAFCLYRENEYLRLVLDTGVFRHIDGYFVLNDSKYIESTSGEQDYLTAYAKKHLSECTLDFTTRLIRSSMKNSLEGLLFHRNGDYKKIASFDATAQNVENYNHAKALQNIQREFDEQFHTHQLVHESTTQRFWKYMQIKKWNTSIFQERTLLNPMDYKRVQDPTYTFKIIAYTAMAVGLELSLSAVNEALQLSGLGYDLKKKEHYAYTYILSTFHGCSIDECNEVLKQLQVPLLGAKSRK